MQNWSKVFFLFLSLGILLFSNSFKSKFMLDDLAFIGNPVMSQTKYMFQQWNPYREGGLGIADNEAQLGYYRPLAHMLYDLTYDAFKNNFWAYHLLNLFLFALASSLIYLFVEVITKNNILAILAGLFYLIHPINGIIVNYISAGVFPFQVIFALGAVILLWESLERGYARHLYFISLLFAFLSLFWHESGIMVPFYISAFVLIFRKEPLKVKVVYLLPYFLIILAFFVFGFFFLGLHGATLKGTGISHLTAGEYLGSFFQALIWYISKLFFPIGIVMQWATPIVHGHIILRVAGLFSLVLVFVWLLIRSFNDKLLSFALVWFLIGFLPFSIAAFRVPENGVQVEPHWFVFSSIGFFIWFAYVTWIVLDRNKKIGIVLLTVLTFLMCSVSYVYNQIWSDPKTYALYWTQQAPGFKSAYYYLAQDYQNEGALKESKKYYQLALTGHFGDVEIYNNLGTIAMDEGHYIEAESYYNKALKITPRIAAVYYNLGALYLSQGRVDLARKDFDRSLNINPFFLNSRTALASISFKDEDYQNAIHLCLKNLEIVNDDTNSLLLLVSSYIQEKDLVNVKKYAYRIIDHVADPKVLTGMGAELAKNGYALLALSCFEKAIRADPGFKEAYLDLGILAFNFGRPDEAIHVWQEGARLSPRDRQFKEYIAKAALMKIK